LIAHSVERVVLNALARKLPPLPPDIGVFDVSSAIGPSRTGIFRRSRSTLALLRTRAWFTSSAARVRF
jgi:hypothetical protein